MIQIPTRILAARPGHLWAFAAVALMLVPAMAGCLRSPVQDTPTLSEALLWNDPHPNLVFYVDYVEGREPSQLALDTLMETARDVTGKENVSMVGPRKIEGLDSDPDRRWDQQDRQEMYESHFSEMYVPRFDELRYAYSKDDNASIHIIYLDGRDKFDAQGLHSYGTIVIFLDSYGGDLHLPFPGRDPWERHVLIHEFGHALGLVNCGIPMVTPREDPDSSQCHSTEPTSVMSQDSGGGIVEANMDQFQDGQWAYYQFDQYDLEDIQSFQASFKSP